MEVDEATVRSAVLGVLQSTPSAQLTAREIFNKIPRSVVARVKPVNQVLSALVRGREVTKTDATPPCYALDRAGGVGVDGSRSHSRVGASPTPSPRASASPSPSPIGDSGQSGRRSSRRHPAAVSPPAAAVPRHTVREHSGHRSHVGAASVDISAAVASVATVAAAAGAPCGDVDPIITAIGKLLRVSGEKKTASEILAALKYNKVVPVESTKKPVNVALAALVKAKRVKRVQDPHNPHDIPTFLSATMERTSVDELQDLCAKFGLTLNPIQNELVQHPDLFLDSDRFTAVVRVECNGHACEAMSQPKLSAAQAQVQACSKVLKKICDDKHVQHPIRKAAKELYFLAYKRGHFLPRLTPYPDGDETDSLEFKGSSKDNDPAWTCAAALKTASKHANFFVKALNTWLMEEMRLPHGVQPMFDAKLVLGVHDGTRSMHGLQIRVASHDVKNACETVRGKLESSLQDSLRENTNVDCSWKKHMTVTLEQLVVDKATSKPREFFVLATVVLDAAGAIQSARQCTDWVGYMLWKKDGPQYRDGASSQLISPDVLATLTANHQKHCSGTPV